MFDGIAAGQTVTEVGRELGLAPRQVRRILAQRRYLGDEKFPQIVSGELWAQAQAALGRVEPYRA